MRLFAYRPAIQGPGRAICATDAGVSFVIRRKFVPGAQLHTRLTLASIEEGESYAEF